jgi:hypothetical protein
MPTQSHGSTNDPTNDLQKMISHLAIAGVASETLAEGLLPVAANLGRLAAAFGGLYADAKGATKARLVSEYGYPEEAAIDAAEMLDEHFNQMLKIAAAVVAAKQGG